MSALEANASARTVETFPHMNNEIIDLVCSFCAWGAVSFTEPCGDVLLQCRSAGLFTTTEQEPPRCVDTAVDGPSSVPWLIGSCAPGGYDGEHLDEKDVFGHVGGMSTDMLRAVTLLLLGGVAYCFFLLCLCRATRFYDLG